MAEPKRISSEYDESAIRWLIEKDTVCEDKLAVEFKSGVMVNADE